MRPAGALARLGAVLLAAAVAGGCASLDGSALVRGKSTAAEVEALMGKPHARATGAAGEQAWLYSRGRQTYAVMLGPDGIVRGVEPRRSQAVAARLTIGKSTTRDVHELLGPPERSGRYPLLSRDILEYPYSDGQDHRALYVNLSYDGVVREVHDMTDWSMYSQSLD